MPYLNIQNVSFAYNGRPVIQGLTLSVEAGEMVGILGPNGSGKTTLIKLVSGVLRPKQGEVKFDGMNLAAAGRKTIARQIAVVPQDFDIPFAFTVGEVVMLGRTPFHHLFDDENGKDREIVAFVMEQAGISAVAGRHFNELSGGERQKVVLATALAQQPRLLLLDEPTVHLDIAHQVEILEQVKDLNRGNGLTVVAAMHDLNLSAMYFDRLVLIKQGKVIASGTPPEVLTEINIREVFSASTRVETDTATGTPHIFVTPRSYPSHKMTGQKADEKL